MHKKPESNKSGTADQIQLMSLSLFMLLLAFFIVLSTWIDFDVDKLKKLRLGIEEAFLRGGIMERGVSENDRAGDGIGTGIENTFTEVEELLRIKVGILGLQRVNNSGTLIVTVPADELFSLKRETLSNISQILRGGENQKVRYELEVLGGVPQTLVKQPRNEVDALVAKLGAFARAMQNEGFPKHRMSIGITHSKENIVDLVFYARRSDKPFVKVNPTDISRGFGSASGGG